MKVHVPLRPEIKLVGNIHGNELPTGEVLLRFVEYLLSNPDNDKRVDEILANSRLHVLVSMNPDGTEIASRESCTSKVGRNNSNKLDLNRNFPDAFFCNNEHLEPETIAVLEWMESLKFVLSGSFHTGAMVTSYGYENWRFSHLATKPQYVATDHDDALRYLAKIYSINHKTMRNTICDNETFIDGITNGGWNQLISPSYSHIILIVTIIKSELVATGARRNARHQLLALWLLRDNNGDRLLPHTASI